MMGINKEYSKGMLNIPFFVIQVFINMNFC